MICFGFDTSNYTTSAAAFGDGVCVNKSRLLPVPVSARGLRQSEALFHHVKALPELFGELCRETGAKADAVAVSDAPRRAEGSYMPCFLAGVNGAEILSKGRSSLPFFPSGGASCRCRLFGGKAFPAEGAVSRMASVRRNHGAPVLPAGRFLFDPCGKDRRHERHIGRAVRRPCGCRHGARFSRGKRDGKARFIRTRSEALPNRAGRPVLSSLRNGESVYGSDREGLLSFRRGVVRSRQSDEADCGDHGRRALDLPRASRALQRRRDVLPEACG